MIMVDQLRAPRWLPFTSTGSGGQSLIDTLLPNIAYLRKTSFSFTNYFVCATACTPSRATLLTGLYSQQNCMFQTQLTAACQPSLQTGFENIASVLGGAGYDCYWVGKWHLSDPAADEAGPTQYEFISAGSFPPGSNYPSPNGLGNEGTEGANPDGVPLNTQPEPPSSHRPAPLNTTVTAVEYYNDAAIATYFNDITMPLIVDAINAGTPWFAAVSFVNPHDMSGFPYNFDLAPTTGVFGTPVIPPNICYPPPNTAGSSGSYSNTGLYPLPNVYNSTYSPPSSWNVNDNVNNTTTGGALVKPGLQLAFQEYMAATSGPVFSQSGWTMFLNYYFWMQKCVDLQIGRVLQNFFTTIADLDLNPDPQKNVTIMFLSDHGDYAGSHWIHNKGGALYDESINVPLYISMGPMRGEYANGLPNVNNSQSAVSQYVCSSVDILPFLYAISQDNDFNWRVNTGSPIQYLAGRESLYDAIYSSVPLQRRVSTIPNQGGAYNNQTHQPYILHTTDEFASANIATMNINVPSHAIAFRTVDLTVNQVNPDGFNVNGGGKLGIYSYWPNPNSVNATYPDLTQTQEFEFYDYTGGNLAEVGNEYITNPTLASNFMAAYNAIAANELYIIKSAFANTHNLAYEAYVAGQNNASCMAAFAVAPVNGLLS
jgi:uncharacterized sulfatase